MLKSKPLRGVLAGALFLAMTTFTGCYGSFALSQKVHKWEGDLGDKWITELVFVVSLPVYGFTVIADGLVFNSFEFWGAENPVHDTGSSSGS